MPTNLDYGLYFNIFLFGILGLAFLVGLVRGLKKSFYSLIVMAIFYVIFFTTLEIAANFIWNVRISLLGDLLGQIMPSLSNTSSLKEALPIVLNEYLADTLGATLSNEEFIAFISSLSILIVKLIYTIIYFTIIRLIYIFICFIIRIIFFRGSKDKDASKHRFAGALCGILHGSLTVFATLVLFGGLISMAKDTMKLLPAEQQLEFDIQPIIDAYDENIIVKVVENFRINDGKENVQVNLYLFDRIFSFNYRNQQISPRKELAIAVRVNDIYQRSQYRQSNNLSDITGEEIREVFNILSTSQLFTSALPLGIEVASDYYDTEIDIPKKELYEIDWDTEVMQLGEIAAVAFDIVSGAGLLTNDGNYEQVTFDGDELRGLFDSLSDSKVATLSAYVALVPILKAAGSDVETIITVPENIVWEDEFVAIGEIAGEIADTGITVGSVKSGDPKTILSALSTADLTVVLNSKIISEAMINVLTGKATIEGIDQIVVPEGIEWYDAYEGDTLVREGELRNILQAVNELTKISGDIDFNNLNFDVISLFTDDAINALCDSKVLIATVSQKLQEVDLGDIPLLISDSVFDEDGYLTKEELLALANSAQIVSTTLACDDEATCENGIDISKAINLSDADVDELLSSDIILATIGNMIIDQGTDSLVIPLKAKDTIFVDGVENVIIKKDEVKRLFKAFAAFEFTSFEGIQVDASILNRLAKEDNQLELDENKASDILSSLIIHATVSDLIIGFEDEEEQVLVVPLIAKDEETQEDIIIRYTDEVEYITTEELTAILRAVIALELTDFENIDTLTVDKLVGNINTVLGSSIIQATVSDQIIKLTDEEAEMSVEIVIPDTNIEGNSVKYEVNGTTFISKAEITAIINTLDILGVVDINSFDGTIDLTKLYNSDNQDTLLLSGILHATVSKQLLDLETSISEDGVTVVIPDTDIDGAPIKQVVGGITYISKQEVKALINTLDVLDITDINDFDGTIELTNLYDDANQTTLLSSGILHATVSKQIIDLALGESATVVIPETDVNNVPIKAEVSGTTFIIKTEVKALINTLDVLDITDINNFTGTIDLTNLYIDANQDILLLSGILHATVSKQILDLGPEVLIVPETDIEGLPVKTLVGGTNFLVKDEIKAMIETLEILNISDINDFTGTINLTNLYSDTNQNTILSSASIHATVSKQILDLGEGVTPPVAIPETDINDISIKEEVNGTIFIIKTEVKALINTLDVLDITDINNFTGTIDLTNLYSDSNQEILLSSGILHATVSKQILDLGPNVLLVPELDIQGMPVIELVGGTNFLVKNEIKAMIETLEILNISDINSFTGTINLTNLYSDTNQNTILSSASIHATISKQMIDLGSGVLLIPATSFSGEEIRKTVNTTEYIYAQEIKALINSLEVLGIVDINSFTGTVDLTKVLDETNQDTLLSSASIHATISRQMLDLGSSILVVPNMDYDNVTARSLVSGTEYVSNSEIKSLINALDVLGISDIDNFTGEVNLTNLFNYANQVTILSSASLHATISRQMLDLGSGVLVVPNTDYSGIEVQRLVSGTDYVSKLEIMALINALEVLNISNINNFDGTFDFTRISSSTNQDTILTSASIHATISMNLLDLPDTVLIVPMYSQTGTPVREEVSLTEFVVKDEIKDLINAFTAMGYSNLDNFGTEIASSKFFTERATLLASDSIHATLSYKLINETNGELLVPDSTRITTDVTYVNMIEINALLDALQSLGLTNFGTMTFDITALYTINLDTLFTSQSLHATISDKILFNAEDETEAIPGSVTLIVPTFFREPVTVNTSSISQIQLDELKNLIYSLRVINVADFSGVMNASTITALQDSDIDTMLDSGSLHVTIDNMLKDNSTIEIPALAKYTDYNISGITTKVEIKSFILAAKLLASDFTAVTFDDTLVMSIINMPASDRAILAHSMIVRDSVTEELVDIIDMDPFYSIDNTFYENNDPSSFLSETGIIEILNHYYDFYN